MVRVAVVGILVLAVGGGLGLPAAAAEDAPVVQEANWVGVDTGEPLPADLVRPEGKTRWDLTGLALADRWVRSLETIEGQPHTLVLVDRDPGETGATVRRSRYASFTSGDDARRWLLPQDDEHLLATSGGEPLRLTRSTGRTSDRLWIRTRRVGVGWVHLPSGPREVVLQRALVLRERGDGGGYVADRLGHRWIDPRAGVVAEVWGPATSVGSAYPEVDSAAVVEGFRSPTDAFRIYTDENMRPILTTARFGWDRGEVTPISSLTPDAYTTIADLTSATAWDFSANNLTNYPTMTEFASTLTEVSPAETSNYGECGISDVNGRWLSREDKEPDDPQNIDISLGVNEREERAGDVTVWLRAGVENEGVSGVGVDAESRTCHDGGGRTPVPLWRFSNYDAVADAYYMQVGDMWNHDPLDCEQTVFTNAIITDTLYAKYCEDRGGLTGTTRGDVLAEGPVTLPSGHTFNALLTRTLVEYCVYLGASCLEFGNFEAVRTVVTLWQVPWIGTVVRLMSTNTEADATSFTTVAATDIKYGLFPPRSISVGTVTDSSVEISWDPGLVTDRIDSYKVYWDTDSGAIPLGTCSTGLEACTADHPGGGSCPAGETCCGTPGDTCDTYANDSEKYPGQVVFDGTSAVIGGLDAGTEHFFTVTSLHAFTDPASSVTTTYESLMYPLQIGGGPAPVPAEVNASTGGGCVLPEATGVVADKVGSDVRFCWDPSAEPCVTGYQILGADQPDGAGQFGVVVNDTEPTNCWTFDPTETYFLVLTRDAAGTGPWGHFGQ